MFQLRGIYALAPFVRSVNRAAITAALSFSVLSHAKELRVDSKENVRAIYSAEFPPHAIYEGNGYLGSRYAETCVGALIRFENSQPNDRAIVLSNGHCVSDELWEGKRDPIIDQPVAQVDESLKTFTVFDQFGQVAGALELDRVLYATFKRTDLALLSLKKTYAEIKHENWTEPLTLSSQHPVIGSKFHFFVLGISGILTSGSERGFDCMIDSFASVKEGTREMAFPDSIRYVQSAKCIGQKGSSGAALILKGTRTVIGVNNMGAEFDKSCRSSRSCYGFGQETYLIYSCLNEKNQLDFGRTGCLLDH